MYFQEASMKQVISTDVVVAYSQCPRKAFLLLTREDHPLPHQYGEILERQARTNRAVYLHALTQQQQDVQRYAIEKMRTSAYLIDAHLVVEDMGAVCDVLTKVRGVSVFGRHSYEPTLIIGTHKVTKEQTLALTFSGYVLGQMQESSPLGGTLIGLQQQAHHIQLAPHSKKLPSLLEAIRGWISVASPDTPPVLLNRHCPSCPFREECRTIAEGTDDLSLLDRMTPKLMRRYQKKGIFSVTQLSYVFKPRKGRKGKRVTPSPFNLELQALALRTGKTYLHQLPQLSRQPVELFVDIEGIPDRDFYYLIGLLVQDGEKQHYHSFWANTPQEEATIWQAFQKTVAVYADAPLYHYGRYERHALEQLSLRHGTTSHLDTSRLVNITGAIYGKVYFPVRSNALKELGKYLGATWTAPNASGLQSLVWRHRWEETQDPAYQCQLRTYNEEDCRALHRLTDELSHLQTTADAQDHIEFAHRPKKVATDIGTQIHQRLEQILRSAHAEYSRKRISFRTNDPDEPPGGKKRGAPFGHPAYFRPVPTKIGKVIRVASRRICPQHKGVRLQHGEKTAEKFITDLALTPSGCRKIVRKYTGTMGYCPECQKYYEPHGITDLGGKAFGHGFQAWVIYQRVVLRLPYRLVQQMSEELLGAHFSQGTLTNFIRYFSVFYASTEQLSLQRLLQSPFVHVDETRLSIQGIDHYVWVFTDGRHVLFKMTESRESTIVQEVLKNYHGTLISDFYGGYDAMPCAQQKCLVHLIRDLNDDLWATPFDTEFESFVLHVKNLLEPIFEAVARYGLKQRHLQKFQKSVATFYERHIEDKDYKSEAVQKFQKRFQRYRNSLFTFLDHDAIPWNNNMAERALRHLAVQRKISGAFFEQAARRYLVLLGIAQTCRFQDKSLLRFLMSEEKDIDVFRAARRPSA
jgi:predicted RecB family nuclease